ncbi:NAD(P)/FAD-dependent oxidoreductase [Georgenia ruanii]|uniref:FAD-dependent oxidoreductase n=1 Tax=Georgenia ruanii TaxID=348442 RepID=A0A7J9UU27_9MICO|nr:FAD-dependent oxidoreductase [Georgenia ruanii]MPV88125.1 FAD-dependent oxidoreductase [Georgenia ruanii]
MSTSGSPRRAVVVGAGMVGLSTAWFLRRAGLDVTVLEQDHVAAGSSWGNAGWLTPPITTPLPEPAILRSGVRALVSPASPLYVPLRPDLGLLRFLLGFVRHSTGRSWRRAMSAYVPLNRRALEAFDVLAAGGVAEPTVPTGDFLACYRRPGQRRDLLEEFAAIRAAGQPVDAELLDGAQLRALAPALSPAVTAGIRLSGTRFIDPPRYMLALADAVVAAGVELREGVRVLAVDGGTDTRPALVRTRPTRPVPGGSETEAPPARRDGEEILPADVVVLATGAWLGELARPFGVRMVVQAGRGYSFSIPVDPMPSMPLYFPTQRVACTPLGGRYRVAGMMEFRRPGDPLDPRRITAIVDAVRPLLAGDLDDRADEWVGSRPVTPDGLPLIGPTRAPRVVAAGGHGMWGITLGPLTGQLVADLVTRGEVPAELWSFDPLR